MCGYRSADEGGVLMAGHEAEPARLEAAGVSVSIQGHPVLHDVTFAAPAGEIVGVVGPNGSGKSTLLRAIAGLRPLDAGTVTIDGTDVHTWSRTYRAKHVALVTQHRDAGADLTVAESVALGRTPHVTGVAWRSQSNHPAVCEAITHCGIADLTHRVVATLSGGQQQRVALARALAQQPTVLLLDEVTNHLDIRATFEVLDVVRALGVTTVAVLHDLSLALRYCRHLCVLDEGRAVKYGPAADAVTADVLADVFGVRGRISCRDGISTIDYAANPLAE